ncbi:M48 family metallopeptidase [Arenimonas oryziterrae]|uniref:YgjP-like metallopeptidase domain-containing protein n=1 Tax=Arenimonas oryziterrae DSM 21050 = YC6267 TaxID=1121015 RepID=A0A091AWM6_9GAMM|nr:SprT family zinc-dependent metalloprotease [Arenimonas oryziterrae]KFN43831.1 hypothetical protein N789_07750 [Arenimonas oryziterrae DSM 21050 = YC6267]
MAWLRFLEPKPAQEQRMLVLRSGEAVPVRWVRDARARRLRLIVGDKGVRLTLPRSASIKLAEQFLFEHRDWLQAQLAKLPVIDTRPFSRDHDQHLLLRGERVPILWSEGRYTRVTGETHGITVACAAKATDKQLRAALRDFYSQQARADIGQWLPRYLPQLPRPPSSFRLRALSSLWGSLAPDDALSLDLSLVLGRPSAFEYVLVHELCHLIHRDHSRRFWREVEARCPDWHDARDYLHGEGLMLKSELRRLA